MWSSLFSDRSGITSLVEKIGLGSSGSASGAAATSGSSDVSFTSLYGPVSQRDVADASPQSADTDCVMETAADESTFEAPQKSPSLPHPAPPAQLPSLPQEEKQEKQEKLPDATVGASIASGWASFYDSVASKVGPSLDTLAAKVGPSIDNLAAKMGPSLDQFAEKISSVTGVGANELVDEKDLEDAAATPADEQKKAEETIQRAEQEKTTTTGEEGSSTHQGALVEKLTSVYDTLSSRVEAFVDQIAAPSTNNSNNNSNNNNNSSGNDGTPSSAPGTAPSAASGDDKGVLLSFFGSVASSVQKTVEKISVAAKDGGTNLANAATGAPSGSADDDAPIVFPWQLGPGMQDKEAVLKSQILKLSQEKWTFMQSPDSKVLEDFQFELNARMTRTATELLKQDPVLEKMRWVLVPWKVKEEAFWRNYFAHVHLVKKAIVDADFDAGSAAQKASSGGAADHVGKRAVIEVQSPAPSSSPSPASAVASSPAPSISSSLLMNDTAELSPIPLDQELESLDAGGDVVELSTLDLDGVSLEEQINAVLKEGDL